MLQKTFRLSVSPIAGESVAEFEYRRGELNHHIKQDAPRHTPPEKLLADLLKRQARRAMADVTACQPDTLPAHLARLEAIGEVIGHHLRHDLAGPEARLSGRQLAYPSTLADFLACIDLTRQNHRCPEFVNPVKDQFDEIIRRLDLLAFFQSKITPTIPMEEEE